MEYQKWSLLQTWSVSLGDRYHSIFEQASLKVAIVTGAGNGLGKVGWGCEKWDSEVPATD